MPDRLEAGTTIVGFCTFVVSCLSRVGEGKIRQEKGGYPLVLLTEIVRRFSQAKLAKARRIGWGWISTLRPSENRKMTSHFCVYEQ